MTVLWSESWAYANGTSPTTITTGLTGAGSSAVVQGNKLRLTTGTSTGGAGKVSRRAVLATATNYEVNTTATLVSTTGDYTGDLMVRVESAVDDGNGYSIFFHMNADGAAFEWAVFKQVNYSATLLYASGAFAGVTVGSTIGMRLRAVGNVIQARVWNTTGSEPTTWPCNVTDSTPYNTAGYVGFDAYTSTGTGKIIDLGPVTITDGAASAVAATGTASLSITATGVTSQPRNATASILLSASGTASGANIAPTANAGSNQTNIAPFSTVNLFGSATDPDGTIASYAWTQTGGPSVGALTTNGPNATFVAPAVRLASTLTFSLVATDNKGATSAPSTVTVGVNRAPLLRYNGTDWYGVQVQRTWGGVQISPTGTAALSLAASGTARSRATGTASLSLQASGVTQGSLTRLPAQPAAIYYGNLTGPTTSSYRQPGALILTSRGNYGHANMIAAAQAGAHVLAYVDALVWSVSSTTDGYLFNSSIYGAAVPKWPGPVNANSTGDLADFRPGSVMHQPASTNASWTKLEAVLERIVTDYPHISGFFADDLGSRSWYSGFDWSTFGSQNQTDYRAGAILILQAFRRVCDRHQLFLMVNGTWQAGTLAAAGGGYPTLTTHGCSLADGGVWEHHDTADAFSQAYFSQSGTQWGSGSSITGTNNAFHLAILQTGESTTQWTNTGNYAWIAQATDYTVTPSAPWTTFHTTGLPTHASNVGTGTTSATATLSISATGTAAVGTMSPPAGAVLNDDLTVISAWSSEDAAMVGFSTLSGAGPGGDPILRNTLIDGQRPSWDPSTNERNDMHGPDVPNGGVRWMTWWERIISIPTNLSAGGWQMVGPNEVHGITLNQATFQPMVGTSWDQTPSGTDLTGRKILDANAGRSTHLFYDVGTVDLGNWHQYKFGVFYTQGSNGWFELWRDGVRIIRFDGITTTESNNGYFKWANYRNTELNGTCTYDISGCRVYRVGSL